MIDKRDECGCHRECTVADDTLGVPPHECEVPCVWPKCLTEAESYQLLADILEDGPRSYHDDWRTSGPIDPTVGN